MIYQCEKCQRLVGTKYMKTRKGEEITFITPCPTCMKEERKKGAEDKKVARSAKTKEKLKGTLPFERI